jgi:hypothetical protein
MYVFIRIHFSKSSKKEKSKAIPVTGRGGI